MQRATRAAAPSDDVTNLLGRWASGTPAEQERLMAAVQGELRRIAAAYLRRERAGHSLQPTALVNEAYLRLVDQRHVPWEGREGEADLARHGPPRGGRREVDFTPALRPAVHPSCRADVVGASKFRLGRHMKGER